MTATSTATASAGPVPSRQTLHQRAAAWARTNGPLHAIVVAQALWLSWAFSRGWFLQADLSNLAEGADQRLTWDYLSAPVGGHFGPVGRFLFWLFDEVARLNYPLTVVVRVVGMAIATVLLYRLLIMLVGRRPLVPLIVTLYAVNPVLLAGTAWFTNSLGLILGEILVLLMITQFVRFERTRHWSHAAATGLLLAGAAVISEQWLISAFVPPLLALLHFARGSLVRRLRTMLKLWWGWLLIFSPVLGVVALQLSLSDPTGRSALRVSDAYGLVRESWLKTMAPSWVGGPWTWFATPSDFISFSAPPDWMVLLGQLGAAVVVILGVQRLGLRSLAAWIMPIVCGVSVMVLVGIGRFATYGNLLAITPRYLSAPIVLFAIGAALALAPLTDDDGVVPQRNRVVGRGWLQHTVATAAIGAVTAMCLVSGGRFALRLGDSNAHDYVTNLVSSARAHGSEVNIYDTAVPPSMIASYEPAHRISDLLHLADVPALFDDPRSEPLIVTADGHLSKAAFVAGPVVAPVPGTTCGTFIHGVGTWIYQLDHVPASAEWFLRLELYQATPSDITIDVVNAHGEVVKPVHGDHIYLGRLEARNLALPLFAPSAVRISSASPDTNLCLTRIAIGGPFAMRGGS